jgi:MoxR-like ATPase
MADTIATAKELMRHYYRERQPCYLEGDPGIGKSEAWYQIATEFGVGFIDVRLAQMDPVDLRGLPKHQGDLVTWGRPDFLPIVERDGEEGIILFDELGDCGKAMQSAAYQPILNGRVGPHIIPPGWYRCAAGNSQKSRAGAQAMSTALANRFNWIEVEADVECWRQYGIKIGIHHAILGFVKFRPNLLHDMEKASTKAFPSPRSWHRASAFVEAPADIRDRLIAGCVGPGAAGEFAAYMRSLDLPELEEILADPKKCRIPGEPAHKYALTCMLSQFADRGNLEKIMTYIKRSEFGRDFEICVVLDATKRDATLAETRAFTEFANRNKDLTV